MTKKRVTPALMIVAVAALVAACGGGGSSSDSGSGSTPAATAGGAGSSTAAAGQGSGDFLDGGFPAAETPTKGGRLSIAYDSNIDCWNGLSYYGISWSYFYFMARGLYDYPNTVKQPDTDSVRPALAADMPTVSPDGLTYTVKLRPGLKFPDGTPVTSKDVKSTYEYILDPNIQCATGGPPSSGYYAGIVGYDDYNTKMTDSKGQDNPGISGIKTVDDLTTSFTLTAPDGSFLRALAMGWSYIREASKTEHKVTDLSPPYVGPYKITKYVTDKSLTIDREPTWADNVKAGVPEEANEDNVDGIDADLAMPNDIATQKLKDNQLDIGDGAIVGSDVPAIAQDPQYKNRYFSTPDASIDYGVFRTDKPPFDNPKVRQAVNYAVDREQNAKIIGGTLSRQPWSQLLSSNLLGSEKTDIYPTTSDPDKAKQLIQESGVATPIKITLVHFAEDPAPQQAQAIKESLDAVGFQVTLKAVSSDAFYGVLDDDKADWSIGLAAWGQDYSDAITYFKPLLTCPGGKPTGSNYGNFCDTAFDSAVDTINKMPPGADRTNQFAKLSTDTATNQTPWWVMDQRRKVNLVSERLGNFIYGPAKQYYFASYFIKQ
jgi:peptide/nickel transport system substrate-binding protein